MKKSEIEHFVSNKIRKATEKAIIEAINDLKEAGHDYEPLDDFLYKWAEPDSEDSLQITCSIGVGVSPVQKGLPAEDPILRSFIALAESDEDNEATILNRLEGDIANGGFMQLYENKGETFIKESIALLHKIGSKTGLQIVEQALSLIYEERNTLKSYEIFLKKIARLNNRFWNLEEHIPAMFMRYRQNRNGRHLH